MCFPYLSEPHSLSPAKRIRLPFPFLPRCSQRETPLCVHRSLGTASQSDGQMSINRPRPIWSTLHWTHPKLFARFCLVNSRMNFLANSSLFSQLPAWPNPLQLQESQIWNHRHGRVLLQPEVTPTGVVQSGFLGDVEKTPTLHKVQKQRSSTRGIRAAEFPWSAPATAPR